MGHTGQGRLGGAGWGFGFEALIDSLGECFVSQEYTGFGHENFE